MQTDIWGSHEWESMSFKAFSSPEIFDDSEKIKYKTFFIHNASVLPCKMCRESFSKIMKHVPIDQFLDGRYSLCYWLFVMHNLVNRKLGKKTHNFTDMIFKYETFRARCGNKNDVVKYEECKKNLKEYTIDDALQLSKKITNKYQSLIIKYIEDYYNSSDVMDEKIHKK